MVGIDEVGRGCLAGPLLVVAAKQLSDLPPGVVDSKQLTRQQRNKIYILLETVCQFGEGWVSSVEIDERGLSGAMKLGVRRALRQLRASCGDRIIMDGPVNYLPSSYTNVECLINADAEVPLVSAASIYAKVKRDNFMIELARKHPDYGFDSHVGYATRKHLEILKKQGAIDRVHRQLFAPVHQLRNLGLWPI